MRVNIFLLLTGFMYDRPKCPDCSHYRDMKPQAFRDGWVCPCCGLFLPDSEFRVHCKVKERRNK